MGFVHNIYYILYKAGYILFFRRLLMIFYFFSYGIQQKWTSLDVILYVIITFLLKREKSILRLFFGALKYLLYNLGAVWWYIVLAKNTPTTLITFLSYIPTHEYSSPIGGLFKNVTYFYFYTYLYMIRVDVDLHEHRKQNLKLKFFFIFN